MIDFVIDPFIELAFMRRALAACVALSLSAPPVGVFLMLRRMSLMGDAMSHAVLPGVAIAATRTTSALSSVNAVPNRT